MIDSHFKIRLVFEHPCRDPGDVTAALANDPDRCWSKGSARTSPDGGTLGGFHKENHWAKELASASFDDRKLARTLDRVVVELGERQNFFHDFRRDGGSIRLETFWNIGLSWPEGRLDYSLLSKLGDLEIDIILTPIVAEKSEQTG